MTHQYCRHFIIVMNDLKFEKANDIYIIRSYIFGVNFKNIVFEMSVKYNKCK